VGWCSILTKAEKETINVVLGPAQSIASMRVPKSLGIQMSQQPTTCPPEQWAVVTVKLARLLEREMRTRLASSSLTSGQYLALAQITSRPGMSRAALARALYLTPQAVGGLVSQLERKRLVEHMGGSPGRPIELTVTATGRALFLRISPMMASSALELIRRCFYDDTARSFSTALLHVLTRMTETTTDHKRCEHSSRPTAGTASMRRSV
jgi:DNA-binding MarR family transcriptional regulator